VLSHFLILKTVLGNEPGEVMNPLIDVVSTSSFNKVVRLSATALFGVLRLTEIDFRGEGSMLSGLQHFRYLVMLDCWATMWRLGG